MDKINRRNCLKRLSTGAGCLFLSDRINTRNSWSMEPSNQTPNIVMIISDDQGWMDYGFMGHPSIETPNLDRLASQSVVFTRGYTAAPLCCPSLASILTGLHPHQHKVTSNDPPFKGPGNQYNPKTWAPERRQQREQIISNFEKAPNVVKALTQLGYRSLQTGKWWMGSYKRGGFTHGMTHGDLDRGGRHGDEGLKIGREGMQPIYDFIEQDESKPFFLWYAPFLPHQPHNPPARLLEKYQAKTESLYIAKYWAMCEWFDETCGELLQYLDKKGLSENTMVLYVCDNGWIQRPDQSGYAERSKRTPYEGGVCTPIMVKWPGHAEPRFDNETLVSAIDLAPTALRACGLEPAADMQGVNLLDKDALAKRKAIFGAAYTHDAVDINKPESSLQYTYALEGDWKLILPSGRNRITGNAELYNVKNDPSEKNDLANDHPEIVKHLTSLAKNWWKESVPKESSAVLKKE